MLFRSGLQLTADLNQVRMILSDKIDEDRNGNDDDWPAPCVAGLISSTSQLAEMFPTNSLYYAAPGFQLNDKQQIELEYIGTDEQGRLVSQETPDYDDEDPPMRRTDAPDFAINFVDLRPIPVFHHVGPPKN